MNAWPATAFDAFSSSLRQPSSVSRLIAEAGLSPDQARISLAAVASEARVGLRLLGWAALRPGHRVLEVGAGAGLLTAFLQSRGVDLAAIEPIEPGFEATSVLTRIVRDTTGVEPRIWPLEARELDPERHGLFDLIFSVNVIEHFQPLDDNLAGLARVMKSDGVQAHTCPNYHVPYEPHYSIPLVPFAPTLTTRIWRGDLRDQPIWRSLNFITSSHLRLYAARHGLAVTFQRGTMGAAVKRLHEDAAFADRQPSFLRRVARLASRGRLLRLLGSVPPGLATPMTVLLRRPPPPQR
jgi:cyclopropane fatty-acyl-phospholipid synthase-like methyltransferase